MTGIYHIYNNVNGKRYIGSAVNIDRRLHHHIIALKGNKHVNKKLQAAWNKHGSQAFTMECIFVCSKSILLFMEQLYIDCFFGENCYNLNPVATLPPSAKGRIRTLESKQKTSNSLMGHAVSSDTRKKIRIANIGRTHSEQTKKKISDGNKGKVISAETRCKMRASSNANTTYFDNLKCSILSMRESGLSFAYIGSFFKINKGWLATTHKKWTQKTKY